MLQSTRTSKVILLSQVQRRTNTRRIVETALHFVLLRVQHSLSDPASCDSVRGKVISFRLQMFTSVFEPTNYNLVAEYRLVLFRY